MASAQATEAHGALVTPRSGGLKEWFWRGSALQAAKAAPKPSSLRRERLRRARLAAELADRTIDPAEPLRDGSALPLAISLYREAAYWALLAQSDAPATPSIRELLDAGTYTKPSLSEADLAVVRSALAEKTFVETAEDRNDVLCREADLSQAFVHGLIHSELEAEDRVTGVLVQRWVRIGVLFAIIIGAALALNGALQRTIQGPDLAAGKPWRTSSKAFDCHPKEMECGGARSAMLFHTNEDDKPWMEVDLGSPQSISRVEVVNREDCCLERAAPLVIEVSSDQKKWTQVAKRAETFREWEATFKSTTARYVRARVDRKSILHLIRLTVRAR
ncbi:MAG: discoidin domain-containing protein [Polyangiales bacterium]